MSEPDGRVPRDGEVAGAPEASGGGTVSEPEIPSAADQETSDPATVLRDYDPYAQAALEPFGFSALARLSLLSL